MLHFRGCHNTCVWIFPHLDLLAHVYVHILAMTCIFYSPAESNEGGENTGLWKVLWILLAIAFGLCVVLIGMIAMQWSANPPTPVSTVLPCESTIIIIIYALSQVLRVHAV